MGNYVLRTFNITKKYGSQTVLNNVSMNVKKGDIYGFVGENGSGKTTIIRVVTGLIFAQSGEYELFGVNGNSKEVLKERKKVGAIVESPSIYANMSAMDNLIMQGEITGTTDKRKLEEILKLVGLEDLIASKKKAGNFSLGMRQRLGIAMALVSGAEFLILDEPLNGLDPAGIAGMRNLIYKLNKEQGITFLISSHILTELALVATTYGIISHGNLVKEISKEELDTMCVKNLVLSTNNNEKLKELLAKKSLSIEESADNIIISGEFEINDIIKLAVDNNLVITNIVNKNTTIEEYYLNLIKGGKNNG